MKEPSHSRRPTAVAILLALAVAAPAAAQTRDAARIAATVDSLAAAALQDGTAAGLSIAVSLDGRPVVAKGYGYADLEWRVPTPERAIYAIGSVTKQFTAAAVLRLVEQGRIDLDVDVTTYLPGFDTHGRRIPVRRLLDHTSGIPSYTSLPHFHENISTKPLPRDTLLRLVEKEPFLFEPGETQVYNNSGFFLLGLIIEKVSGTSYAEYVRQNLFAPAGMNDSRYCSETEVVPGMTHGYRMGERGLQHAARIDHTWPYAAGSLCSTAADLDAWNRALHGGAILGSAAYREMITPGSLNDGSPLRYAKGLAVSEIAARRAFHHGGDIDGFATYLQYFPDERLSIAIVVNTQGPVRPVEIARTIAERILGAPAAPPPFRGAVADYVGEYRGTGGYGEELVMKVVAAPDGGLILQGPLVHPDGPSALGYVGSDTFRLADMQLTFARERGRVVKLHVDAVYVHLVLRRDG